MSLITILTIALWIFAFVLFVGIIIVVFVLGRRSLHDNNKIALVFVKTGNRLAKPIKANLAITSDGGAGFIHGKKTVIIPAKYNETYYQGRRLIFINHNSQIITSPFDDKPKLSADEKSDLIYELYANHVGSDAIRAIKGKQSANVVIVGIIAFVFGIGATFAVNMTMDYMKKQQQAQPQAEQKLPVPSNIKQ